MSTYWEKLQDPKWQKRRLEVFKRADFKCEECSNDKETLHAHHKIYHKGRDPWDYSDKELACLCDSCHARWHEVKDLIDRIVAQLPIARMREMLNYGIASAMDDGSAVQCTLPDVHAVRGFTNYFRLDPEQIPKIADEGGWVHIESVREVSKR